LQKEDTTFVLYAKLYLAETREAESREKEKRKRKEEVRAL
jgi:hypothetical protein